MDVNRKNVYFGVTMNTKIMERARKLLALSQRGGTPQEAEAAALQLQKLLLRHNLEIQQINEEPVYDAYEFTLSKTPSTMKWERLLFAMLANCHMCRGFFEPRNNSMIIIGRKDNIEMVHYLFKFLRPLVEHHAKMNSRHIPKEFKYRYEKSYRHGMIVGIQERLEEQLKQFEQEEGLLVIPDQEGIQKFAESLFQVKPQKPRKQKIITQAFVEGMYQGLRTSINRELQQQERRL